MFQLDFALQVILAIARSCFRLFSVVIKEGWLRIKQDFVVYTIYIPKQGLPILFVIMGLYIPKQSLSTFY